jgi:hypothetical protein
MMTTMLATGMNYGVASFPSCAMTICNFEMNTTRIADPGRLLRPFEGEHLEHAQTSQPAPISPSS